MFCYRYRYNKKNQRHVLGLKTEQIYSEKQLKDI